MVCSKLIAIICVRKQLVEMFPGCEFLLPTMTDTGSAVGLRFSGRTILAEHKNHWEAYHRLVRKAVGNLL